MHIFNFGLIFSGAPFIFRETPQMAFLNCKGKMIKMEKGSTFVWPVFIRLQYEQEHVTLAWMPWEMEFSTFSSSPPSRDPQPPRDHHQKIRLNFGYHHLTQIYDRNALKLFFCWRSWFVRFHGQGVSETPYKPYIIGSGTVSDVPSVGSHCPGCTIWWCFGTTQWCIRTMGPGLGHVRDCSAFDDI